MARPSNTEERRAQIVHGLMSVMAERGYDGASVPAIAEAAGLTPGLVHYHFRNKLEILLSLLDELAGLVRARFERRTQSAASPRARLAAFLDAHVALGEGASSAAVACWVAIGSEALRDKDVQVAYKRVLRESLEVLTQLVVAVLADEQRRTDTAAEIASALLAAIHGFYQLATAAHAVPRGAAAPALRHMAEGLLACCPEVRP
jgi:TetR/AcrR family transcriptional repressor of bet genes